MLDKFGRNINYLRLSLTDRCQLHCAYCSKSEGSCIKEKELDTETVAFAVNVFGKAGMNKIRLTGGEPLLRKDICEIVKNISLSGYYKDIALTTNGQLLPEKARELKNSGLHRCNISLDSLKDDVYYNITGASLDKTLKGIDEAQMYFSSVKLNTVLVKGVNDTEIDDFILLTRDNNITLRFIELMPLGDGGEGIKNSEILKEHPYLMPCESDKNEPAVYYKAEGYKGKIGFISPMSSRFCGNCNRLRMTYDGKLRLCLGNNSEISIREELLSRDEKALTEKIKAAIDNKPEKGFEDGFLTDRKMNRIGG